MGVVSRCYNVMHVHACDTYIIAAAVNTKECRERDGSTEEKQCVQEVKDDHEEWVESKVWFDRGRDEIEER